MTDIHNKSWHKRHAKKLARDKMRRKEGPRRRGQIKDSREIKQAEEWYQKAKKREKKIKLPFLKRLLLKFKSIWR